MNDELYNANVGKRDIEYDPWLNLFSARQVAASYTTVLERTFMHEKV